MIPKMKKYKMIDLLSSRYPSAEIRGIGIRPGEKMVEELLSQDEHKGWIEYCQEYWLIKQKSGVVV